MTPQDMMFLESWLAGMVRASLVDLKVNSSMTRVSGDASACGMGLIPELSIIVLLPNVNSICVNGEAKVPSGIET
jgi:hypothetical protein